MLTLRILILNFIFVCNSQNTQLISTSDVRRNHEPVCKPSGFNIIRTFIQKNWEKARLQLNITDASSKLSFLSFNDSEYVEKFKDSMGTPEYKQMYLMRFYKHSQGIMVFGFNDTIISYANIYKCANEGIMKNLMIVANRFGIPYPFTHWWLPYPELQNKLKANIRDLPSDNFSSFYHKLNLTNEFRSKLANFKTFTFIRNPMDHFESAMR